MRIRGLCKLPDGKGFLWEKLGLALVGSEMKVAQSCPTLCNPMDYTVHRSLNARIMDWVTFPSPGVLPNPGIEPRSLALQADALTSEPPGKLTYIYIYTHTV